MTGIMTKKQNLICCLSSLAVGAVFVLILAVNGLWPFGRDTIDYYDMAQWADMFYYHNYDELRGLQSLLFDWYMDLGRVIPGPDNKSLFDLLFYFVPRRSFLEASSFLLAVKLMAAAFTMNLFVNYLNPRLNVLFRIMLSAGYGLCGFVLANYTLPQKMDMMALVPLFLMFSQIAVKEGKILGLSVVIFLLMIDEYYFAMQAVIGVFLIGGVYVFYSRLASMKSDGANKPNVFALAVGVITGMALSAFSWLPNIAFAISSARFSNGNKDGLFGSYIEILNNVKPVYLSRWFTLLAIAFPAALLVKGLTDAIRRKEYKKIVYVIAVILLFTIQLVIESVSILLHFGSYVNYPVRNGFMIYCVIAASAAVMYIPADEKETSLVGRRKTVSAIVGAVAVAAAVMGFDHWYKMTTSLTDHDILLITFAIMTVFAVIHFVMISRGYKRPCFYMWFAELLIFGIIMIGKPNYTTPYGNDPEQEGEYIRIADQLTEGFAGVLKTGKDAATQRIKNPDTSLNANYGVVLRRETLSGWTNLETHEQISGATGLGYSSQLTRLLDSGGNIFSDTLLHITEAVSHEELDEKLYKKIASTDVVIDHMTGEKEVYYLYENRFELPFAIPVTGPVDTTDASDISDTVNAYAAAMGSEDEVATRIAAAPSVSTDNGIEISEYSVDVTGNKTLYFAGKCVDTDHYNTRIFVNGKVIRIPSIKENDNELYPAHFNNNSVELGSFCDETVTVRIEKDITDEDKMYDQYLYEIDIDVLAALCKTTEYAASVMQGSRSLDISIKGLDDRFKGLLIPVSYDNGWNATVNGKDVSVLDVNGLFMYVPVSLSDSEIQMSYFPPVLRIGLIIACIGALCLILILKKRSLENVVLNRVLAYMYMTAFVIVIAIVYVIPVVYAVIAKGFS